MAIRRCAGHSFCDFDFYAMSPVGTGVDRLKRLNAGGLGGNLGTYKWVTSMLMKNTKFYE